MEAITNNYNKEAEELFDKKKFEAILTLLTDDVLETQMSAELFLYRGIGRYYNKDYNNAIKDYNVAINLKNNFAEVFYNRGLAYFAKKEYKDAIVDFNKAIDLNSKYTMAYLSRGSIKRVMKKYDKAILDFNEAFKIDSKDENIYYNRGLTYYYKGLKGKEGNIYDFKKSKQDFEEYLKLAIDEDKIWVTYAAYYVKDIDKMIQDPDFMFIRQLVENIKDILLIKEKSITHYTTLSALKSLILDNNKFRISEGNFMNDPSEGKEFFDFLKFPHYKYIKRGSSVKTFSTKPFISSFVTKDKRDDLNMWRFYGKEKGEEARGCAITLCMQKFIEDIESCLSNEKNKEARLDDEYDINFYRVVYVNHKSIEIFVPNLDPKKREELKTLMINLREKVKNYISKVKDITSLEEYLNSIAFLFKSDAYKNENEVRLVIKGINFVKKYEMKVSSPSVYIETKPIKKIVSQITLGPKVDKVSEWIAAFHYCYEGKIPEITNSRVPFK